MTQYIFKAESIEEWVRGNQEVIRDACDLSEVLRTEEVKTHQKEKELMRQNRDQRKLDQSDNLLKMQEERQEIMKLASMEHNRYIVHRGLFANMFVAATDKKSYIKKFFYDLGWVEKYSEKENAYVFFHEKYGTDCLHSMELLTTTYMSSDMFLDGFFRHNIHSLKPMLKKLEEFKVALDSGVVEFRMDEESMAFMRDAPDYAREFLEEHSNDLD